MYLIECISCMDFEDVFGLRVRRRGREELTHLLIAWISLAFVFSIGYFVRAGPRAFTLFFVISLIAVGSGFILHELAHKYTARYFGHWAEFRISQQGLLLTFLFSALTLGQVVFAAPGATVIIPAGAIFGYGLTRRENGIISAAGPITNLLLALVFFLASNLYTYIPVSFQNFYAILCSYGIFINVWLAAFNLLPIWVLDGKKIFDWDIRIWSLLAIPSWAISILIISGLI
jgi:Zn-dependent protease